MKVIDTSKWSSVVHLGRKLINRASHPIALRTGDIIRL